MVANGVYGFDNLSKTLELKPTITLQTLNPWNPFWNQEAPHIEPTKSSQPMHATPVSAEIANS